MTVQMPAAPPVTREPHTPDFSIEIVDDQFTWVRDSGRRIALIDDRYTSLEWIAPHPDIDSPRPAILPSHYHAPTYQGGRLILQWWLTNYGGWRSPHGVDLAPPIGATPNSRTKLRPKTTWQWLVTEGPALRFVIDQQFDDDPTCIGRHDVTIRFDPITDSYVADWHGTFESGHPYYAEAANLYAAGLYDPRPQHKRYRWTCWTHPSGETLRMAHNPVHVLAPGCNDGHGLRRIAAPGFIGYVCDPHSNPMLQVLSADCELTAATCCNLYDEHLICLPDGDGPQRYELRCRFGSVHPQVAGAIFDASRLLDLGIDASTPDPFLSDPDADEDDLVLRIVNDPRLPGFQMDGVNGFDEPVPFDEPYIGMYFFAAQSPDNRVYWDKDVGRNGGRSIRLRGDGGMTEVRNQGPTIHVEPNTAYTLRCYVKCRGVVGRGAMVALDEIGSRRQDLRNRHIAGPLIGDSDWTLTETTFRTRDTTDLAMLRLVLDGSGEAWFDDLQLCAADGGEA